MTVALHKPWTPLSETSGSAAVLRGLQTKLYDKNYCLRQRHMHNDRILNLSRQVIKSKMDFSMLKS